MLNCDGQEKDLSREEALAEARKGVSFRFATRLTRIRGGVVQQPQRLILARREGRRAAAVSDAFLQGG